MLATFVEELADAVPWYWWAIGFGGQLFFFLRMYVQWRASERAKRSVVPVSFWWFSLLGSAMLLAYAIYKLDPVFMLGQATGSYVYLRNLVLIRRTAGPVDPSAI